MKLKKTDITIGIVFLLLASAVAFSFYISDQKKESSPANGPVKGKIEIYGIEGGQVITSPLLIKGKVTGGNWSGFEGQVGVVELIGSEGEKLGSAILTATSDWMKLPTSFETNLIFESSEDNNVSLVFHNENPSGLPDKNEVMSLPLRTFEDTTAVKVYFGKQGNDSCTRVFPIEKNIVKTEAIAQATIEELIKGPTAEEKQAGYFTGINQNSKVNKLTITNGKAKVDFDKALEEGVGGSCKVAGIRQQIIETLMQFSSIKTVIISVEGRTEDILQP